MALVEEYSLLISLNAPGMESHLHMSLANYSLMLVIFLTLDQHVLIGTFDFLTLIFIFKGVTVGYDMTAEATLTKLAYVLSKPEWDIQKKRKMMETNLRGELTTCDRVNFQDRQLFLNWLGLSSETELNKLGPIIFPAMLFEAVIAKDVEKLELLRLNVSSLIYIPVIKWKNEKSELHFKNRFSKILGIGQFS